MLYRVALTGADDSTSVDELIRISKQYPFVEWGILHSVSNQGNGRYPSFDWIREFVAKTKSENIHSAAHVCGRMGGDMIAVAETAANFERVQINFNSTHMPIYPGTNAPLTLDVLDRMMQENIGAYFITQHNKSNADVYKQIVALNHEVLFDASGGRGILGDWHSPIPGKICGYAGGLGPDNVLQELEKISAICNKPFWIDMEGKLRTDDKFDLTKCVAVLDQIDSKYGSPL